MKKLLKLVASEIEFPLHEMRCFTVDKVGIHVWNEVKHQVWDRVWEQVWWEGGHGINEEVS